jgi:hypothetical protein
LGLIDLLLTPHDDAEDFSGDIALQTANGFQLRVPGSDAFGNVGLGARVQSQPPDRDNVDGAVGRAITASVQSVPRLRTHKLP